jgi:hypothetical protein
MSSTTFIDGQTVIYATWLNDVNAAVYSGTFPNGSIVITNLNATNSTITNLTATSINLPSNFSITQSGSKIYFKYNGSNIASLDSSGNFIALANVTAYGTP